MTGVGGDMAWRGWGLVHPVCVATHSGCVCVWDVCPARMSCHNHDVFLQCCSAHPGAFRTLPHSPTPLIHPKMTQTTTRDVPWGVLYLTKQDTARFIEEKCKARLKKKVVNFDAVLYFEVKCMF